MKREENKYECFLKKTRSADGYMPDAIRATIELMEAPASKSISGLRIMWRVWVFTREIAAAIARHVDGFPLRINRITGRRLPTAGHKVLMIVARETGAGKEEYNLETMTSDMLKHLRRKTKRLIVIYLRQISSGSASFSR
jgi:hypothetical protein